MKGIIYDETLKNAFQSEETFFDFIDKFKAYYDYITIISLAHPNFEMSFEEYVEKFDKKHEKIPLL